MKSSRKPRILLITLLLSMPAWSSELAVLHNGYSVHYEKRKVLGEVTRLYVGVGLDDFVDVPTDQIDHFEVDPVVEDSPSRSNSKALASRPIPFTAVQTPLVQPRLDRPAIDDLITAASNKNHLDSALINSVIHAESGFNSRARSPKGAQGLMQLMPQTASQLGVADAYNAEANVQGGARYLRELLEQYNFDLVKALAAYNAGPMRVQQYRGVPPYRETRAYIARIVKDYNRQKLAEMKLAKAGSASAAKSVKGKAKTIPSTSVQHLNLAELKAAPVR